MADLLTTPTDATGVDPAPNASHAPASHVFLTARWQWLLMLNYEVSREIVAPYVPRGCEVDTFEGRTYASLVGFLFRETRVRGFSIPGHRHFAEVNLRLYVRRPSPEGWRRGVVFVKEIVPRIAIAAVARALYNENYVARPMRSELTLVGDRPAAGSTVAYAWRLGARWQRIAGIVQGEPTALVSGGQAEFIAEHYWGYARQRGGGTVEYRVEHVPWRVWGIVAPQVDVDIAAEYGPTFAAVMSGPPATAFLAEGSPVVVYRGVRIA